MTNNKIIKNLICPEGKIDVVLDTDAYNEIDDQFALSYLVKRDDKINLKGILAAPFLNTRSTSPKEGMEKSYDEIIKLLTLLKREDLKKTVFRGSEYFLKSEEEPVISDAANYLSVLAMEYSTDKPLYVVAIGAITDVASALLIKPEIADRIVVVWLGGHGDHINNPTSEFNMVQDIAAARVVFSSGAPLVQLPCLGVVSQLSISKYELIHWLKGKGDLCDYLADNAIEEADSYAEGKPWTRVIWDLAAAIWLVNDGGRFLRERIIPTYMPGYDGEYHKADFDRPMKYIFHIERDAIIEEMIRVLTDECNNSSH